MNKNSALCQSYEKHNLVILFQRHADGVVSVGFAEVEPADVCIKVSKDYCICPRKDSTSFIEILTLSRFVSLCRT